MYDLSDYNVDFFITLLELSVRSKANGIDRATHFFLIDRTDLTLSDHFQEHSIQWWIIHGRLSAQIAAKSV